MNEPLVFLVGAGPGDPGLLTLRAQECLRRADFVLYDQLVSKRTLDHAPPGAELKCVRDLPGDHPQRWPHIHRVMIEKAKEGKVVVRLKGGDPLIFGRAGEEAEALRQEGIRYEVVPGITASLAAGAYLDIPLTHRASASALALITGHENPTKNGNLLDWEALARFPGTLAIYMGIARLPLIIEELTRHGLNPQTPAAVVQHASMGQQRWVFSPLEQLETERRAHGLDAPSMVFIGDVVGLRGEPGWFSQRPLLNQRVVVTRPRGQSEPMVRKLELLGAVPYHLPVVAIREPEEWGPVDAALERIGHGDFDWLVFTSANGVRYLLDRLYANGRDLRALASVKIACIGPATAEVLEEYHLRADLVPESDFMSENFADQLRRPAAGKRVLLARANRGREVLRERLSEVAQVEQVAVYTQYDAMEAESEVLDHLRRGEVDFVTFTSPNIARGFLRGIDETIQGRIRGKRTRLVCISPVTAEAVAEFGFEVAGVADTETEDGVIAEVVRLAGV